ncbi:MAG TPA: hypothetical protein VE991_05510 [Acidimicrobiales bacterium]|nr:hypothetical protein [Acidimicrobiales bacterium]
MPAARLAVYLEVGRKLVFASAAEWPGWSRSAKDEDGAIGALLDYVDRYRPVAARAGLRLPAVKASSVDVVERLPGDTTTDFGAPNAVAEAEHRPGTRAQAARRAGLVQAAWDTLDEVAAHAPQALRKGPRGGGRDRDAVVAHVFGGEQAYAAKIGLRLGPSPKLTGPEADAWRAPLLAALSEPDPPGGRLSTTGKPGWPGAYCARRVAWHVLDHVWEIEDKSS